MVILCPHRLLEEYWSVLPLLLFLGSGHSVWWHWVPPVDCLILPRLAMALAEAQLYDRVFRPCGEWARIKVLKKLLRRQFIYFGQHLEFYIELRNMTPKNEIKCFPSVPWAKGVCESIFTLIQPMSEYLRVTARKFPTLHSSLRIQHGFSSTISEKWINVLYLVS